MTTSAMATQSSPSCCHTFYVEHSRKCALFFLITAVVAVIFAALGAAGLFPPPGNFISLISGVATALASILAVALLYWMRGCFEEREVLIPTHPIPSPDKPEQSIEEILRSCSCGELKFNYLPRIIVDHEQSAFDLVIERLMKENQLKNYADDSGCNIFHQIARSGTVNMLDCLRANQVLFQDIANETSRHRVLHYSVLGNNDKLIAPLCALGADINQADKEGFTPLHLAVQQRDLNCVKALVQNGAKLGLQTYASAATPYKTPYGLLPEVPTDEPTRQIKEYLESLPEQNRITLQVAMEQKDLTAFKAAVDRLIAKNQFDMQSVDPMGQNIFHQIARWGSGEMFDYLESVHVTLQDQPLEYSGGGKYYLVHAAVFGNNHLLIPHLKQMGLNLDAQDEAGCTALHHAANAGDFSCVKALVEAGATLTLENTNGQTPYESSIAQIANDEGSLQTKRYFESLYRSDYDALFASIQSNDSEAFKTAVDSLVNKRGLNIRYKNELGRNVFHAIAKDGSLEMLDYLQQKGLKFKDFAHTALSHKKGNTVLHFAAIANNVSLITPFQKLGANVNAQNGLGFTPLHCAVQNGNLDCIKALVEAGADLFLRTHVDSNESDKTPYELLMRMPPESEHFQEIQHYLQSVGAHIKPTEPIPTPSKIEPSIAPSGKLSFLEYKNKRELEGAPIDLIVGRGRAEIEGYPQLCTEHSEQPYSPFMVDIEASTLPDYQGDITCTQSMGYFPDSSVDQIYLERLYSQAPLLDIRTYYNASRILKRESLLIVDVNGLCRKDQIRKIGERFNALFFDCQIPLVLCWGVKSKMNDLSSELRLTFMKCGEFKPDLLKEENADRLKDVQLRMSQILSD